MCDIEKCRFFKLVCYKNCSLFSTCVEEALLCKGIPLCKNKNDLKACNLPILDVGYDFWRPINFLSSCTPIGHPEYTMPFAQTVEEKSIADGSQYHCLNRGDENPFAITISGSNGTEDDSYTWTQWINTKCTEYRPMHRRCLGSRPDLCIDAYGEYIFS